jgi:hypothetical protein
MVVVGLIEHCCTPQALSILYHSPDDGHDDVPKHVETPINTSSSASGWLFIHLHDSRCTVT